MSHPYTLEQVKAMPWPVDALMDLFMRSAKDAEDQRISSLREDNKRYSITFLETELMEVPNEIPNV